jgi:hypothetical protein
MAQLMAGGVGLEALDSTSSWESLCSLHVFAAGIYHEYCKFEDGIKMFMFSACPMEVKDASALIGLGGLYIEGVQHTLAIVLAIH